MTTLFLVRHGRTVWNKEQIFRGIQDIPLDEVGRQEAQMLGERLHDEEITAVYSSPLSRARETAEAIARFHDLEVLCHNGFNDLGFGEWEGMHRKEVQERYPDLYRQWEQEPHRVIFPGGDGLGAVCTRTMDALKDIVARYQQKTMVIVSHRVVLKVMICALLGLDNSHFWHINQDTATLNCFRHRNGIWAVAMLNDTCHLKSMKDKANTMDF